MKLGLIGFGQVGSSFAKGLKEAGLREIVAYDKMWNTQPSGELIQRRAKEAGIPLLHNTQELVTSSDIIICVTAANVAIESAREAAPYLGREKIYADLNSASPKAKQEIAKIVEARGTKFVDGAIMGAISLYGHKSPIVVCGEGARDFTEALAPYGMEIRNIGEGPGRASALKMIRSVFAKGIEAVLLEALDAAYECNVLELVLDSICEMMDKEDFRSLANMLVTTNAIHAQRRAYEMDGVIETLSEAGVDSRMSRATREKLQWSSDLGLREEFRGEVPGELAEVLVAISRRKRGSNSSLGKP